MEVSVISIGNSRGIRLSKTILEKYKINSKVELILEENQIIIKSKKSPRQGWDLEFKSMHENGDDELLMPDVFEDEHFDS